MTKPMITSSALGTMGRFANKAFQYMFLRSYAAEHEVTFANLRWEGDDMFNLQPGVAELPKMDLVLEETVESRTTARNHFSDAPTVNTDFRGYFQYNMTHYAPLRAEICADFTHKGPYLEAERALRAAFEAVPGPIAAIHLRRGDFGKSIHFVTPNKWFVTWLRTLQREEPTLKVFIASDDPAAARKDFAEFDRITLDDFDLPDVEHGFFYDFTALRLADHVGIANSSFSFLAAALNETARSTVRPDPAQGGMVPFEAWTSDPLLRHYWVKDMGPEFSRHGAKSRAERMWLSVRNTVRGWFGGKRKTRR